MKRKLVCLLLLTAMSTTITSCDLFQNSNPDIIYGNQDKDCVSILEIKLTSSIDNVDYYTIYYTNGTTSTFKVTNGTKGDTGPQGPQGESGKTPEIVIGSNGNWFINGIDTNVSAKGETLEVKPEFRVENGILQWKYTSETQWKDLIDFDEYLDNYIKDNNETSEEPSSPSEEPSSPSEGPSSPSEGPSNYPLDNLVFDTKTPVTITFYSTMGDNLQEVFNVYLEEFQELYPNITVNHQQPGGYDDVRDQIKIELSNGLHPNLAYCYPDHVALYNKVNGVIPLDELINHKEYGLTKEQQEDFIEGFYNEGKQFGDDKMYSLPFSKSSEVMYYNKTFFDANNIKVPRTWDEMFDVCRKIKAIDPNCIPLGYDSSSNLFINLTEQYNTGYTTNDPENRYVFNNAENKEIVAKFAKVYQDGYMTTQAMYGSYTSGLFVSQDPLKSYISIASSAGASHQAPQADAAGIVPFEVGIASIPQADINNGKVIFHGPSVCIFNDEDPQKIMASWLLSKYLTTSVEFQAQFSIASGYIPVLKSVVENKIYKTFLSNAAGYKSSSGGINALSNKVCLEQQDWYYTLPAFIGSSEARDQVGELLNFVFVGSKTVDQAFKYALEKCIENS